MDWTAFRYARWVAVLGVTAAVTLAAAAEASTAIFYRCGSGICRIRPDGSGKFRFVSGSGYRTPSVSKNGQTLAFARGNTAYARNLQRGRTSSLGVHTVLATFASPDGKRVAVINEQQEADGHLTPYLVQVAADGRGYANVSRGPVTAGYLGRKLLRDGYSAVDHSCRAGLLGNCPAQSICVIRMADGTCDHNVADDPSRDLYDPDGSPDGSLVAATATPYPDNGSPHPDSAVGRIAIYRAATGRLVRDLTTGRRDSDPSFSPDGRQIVFVRGSRICVTSARTRKGRVRCLAAGDSPSWGKTPRTRLRGAVETAGGWLTPGLPGVR